LKLSLAEILDNLERRVAFLREQVAIHVREEEHHREQRTLLAAELETTTQHLEALKTVAVPAAELLKSAAPETAPEAPASSTVADDPDIGPNSRVGDLIARILASRPDAEPFGPTAITAEINRRFQARLGKAADVRNVSSALRRLQRAQRIHLVREGRSYYEALYAKGPRPRKQD
jgi:hypothetical protein